MDTAVRRGPEPRFCSFVLAHETCRPSGAVVEQKLDGISVEFQSQGRNKMVSSAYTGSVKPLRPTSIPECVDTCSIIQSMAMQKRAGVRIHPCLTPDVVQNQPESWWIMINPNSSTCRFVQCHNETESKIRDAFAAKRLKQYNLLQTVMLCSWESMQRAFPQGAQKITAACTYFYH